MDSRDYNIFRNIQINQLGSDQLKIETYDHDSQSITGVTSYIFPVKSEMFLRKKNPLESVDYFRIYRITEVVFSLEHHKVKSIESTIDFDVERATGLFDSYTPNSLPAPYRRISYSQKIVNINHVGRLLEKHYNDRIDFETFYESVSIIFKAIYNESGVKKWKSFEDYYSELSTI